MMKIKFRRFKNVVKYGLFLLLSLQRAEGKPINITLLDRDHGREWVMAVDDQITPHDFIHQIFQAEGIDVSTMTLGEGENSLTLNFKEDDEETKEPNLKSLGFVNGSTVVIEVEYIRIVVKILPNPRASEDISDHFKDFEIEEVVLWDNDLENTLIKIPTDFVNIFSWDFYRINEEQQFVPLMGSWFSEGIGPGDMVYAMLNGVYTIDFGTNSSLLKTLGEDSIEDFLEQNDLFFDNVSMNGNLLNPKGNFSDYGINDSNFSESDISCEKKPIQIRFRHFAITLSIPAITYFANADERLNEVVQHIIGLYEDTPEAYQIYGYNPDGVYPLDGDCLIGDCKFFSQPDQGVIFLLTPNIKIEYQILNYEGKSVYGNTISVPQDFPVLNFMGCTIQEAVDQGLFPEQTNPDSWVFGLQFIDNHMVIDPQVMNNVTLFNLWQLTTENFLSGCFIYIKNTDVPIPPTDLQVKVQQEQIRLQDQISNHIYEGDVNSGKNIIQMFHFIETASASVPLLPAIDVTQLNAQSVIMPNLLSYDQNQFPTVIPEPLKEPSTDPLPYIFSEYKSVTPSIFLP